MKKTNRTYHVFVGNDKMTAVLGMGTKNEMIKLYNETKNNDEFDCVILSKWSVRYNCWYTVEKQINR